MTCGGRELQRGGDLAFTIANAFDLLFGDGKPASAENAAIDVRYEDRRWFRQPPPLGMSADQLQLWRLEPDQAEKTLLRRVLRAVPTWRERLPTAGSERFKRSGRGLGADFGTLDPKRHLPPRSPYDVFAISAYLIDTAGIYHHIQSEKMLNPGSSCANSGDEHLNDSPRHLHISQADRDQVSRAADAWRNLPWTKIFSPDRFEPLARHMVQPAVWADLEPLFESWAVVFAAYADADVFISLRGAGAGAEPAPGWWKHAWRLFAISDEAARGTGFRFDTPALLRAIEGNAGSGELQWFEAQLFLEFAVRVAHLNRMRPARSRQEPQVGQLRTCSVARTEFVGVLPKVRTPSMGCTLRSLSHHLAMMPGRGLARGRWTPTFPRASEAEVRSGQMNMLLVPFPYKLEARAFCASLVEKVVPGEAPRFGYFDVHQHWLSAPAEWREQGLTIERALVNYMAALMAAARRHAHDIHAVVFPELSLNHDVLVAIQDYLEQNHPDVEVLVAGVSERLANLTEGALAENPDAPTQRRRGNFVSVTTFNRNRARHASEGRRSSLREKHHRWKLDATQLGEYGLQGVLAPELQWWENIPLQSRRVDFSVIRQRSVLAAMICEDLARVDPCQQLIRAVAPNLVVALLMDAPQKAARWPARYATVLAEDPGCAVLTLTSRALMARQEKLGIYPPGDRTVAMWRDDRSGKPLELNCPNDAQAVLLTVVEEGSLDLALDGRRDESALAFRYKGHVPVRVLEREEHFDYILGEGLGS